MKHRTALAMVAALAALVGSAPTAAAHPHVDHRPCVAKREFNGSLPKDANQAEVEHRWDVSGLSHTVGDDLMYYLDLHAKPSRYYRLYKSCGSSDLDEGGVIVTYRAGSRVWLDAYRYQVRVTHDARLHATQ